MQPNFGLDRVFGAVEDEVEFMPDIGDRIRFDLDGERVDGGGFLQSYRLAGGTARGAYPDGRLAVVEHRHGRGRTLLVGTHPSVAYNRKAGAHNLRYFAEVFRWSGKPQHVRLSATALSARVHDGPDGRFLWVVNPTRAAVTTEIDLAAALGRPRAGPCPWPVGRVHAGGTTVEVPARDVVILRLDD